MTQIYFYASYVFHKVGILAEHLHYAITGISTCEVTTCILCVSFQQEIIHSHIT